MEEDFNSELESFRRKWKEEVSAKAKADSHKEQSVPGTSKLARRPPAAPRITDKTPRLVDEEEEDFQPQNFISLDIASNPTGSIVEEIPKQGSREPRSALEHYERAVERETQGSLGDSLSLYRKAFKLDNKVDQEYKKKHFPPSHFASKAPNVNPSHASATVPNTAHRSLDGPSQTINELIAGFSGLSIEPAPPAIEGTTAPPCPIADLPGELLIHIFRDLAVADVASFVRMAQVCKHMAFIVATEESIWKRICEGSEVGFGAMHYSWQREVLGEPLELEVPEFDENGKIVNDAPEDAIQLRNSITETLLHKVYKASWYQMFRMRPRIRFNGCYISTNNYIRPGQASANQFTWNSPVHIVTYYRYLRFFRDGTLISLLTTSEPTEVVHFLTKELLETHQGKASSHLPSSVMECAHRGRWRLSSVHEHSTADLRDAEGDLCVETEGVGPKYIFRMDLTLRHAGKGTKNNKLAWNGFWSYNKLTDDWAEFTRRNEKPLFWSRVKSYGTGS
ncbi:hypothetical protein B0O99DRAFT_78674 [Bisporella sp. PMI_857]|nr:hypothetical protein B0O99DRAFT_78674 [Bisporella sp. PMI_857]